MSQSRVQLFATCLGDLLFPEAVADAEQLLRRAGYEVGFPPARSAAASLPSTPATARPPAASPARLRAFSHETPIVVPSGSCATMAVHNLPELLGCESLPVRELSDFLAEANAPLPRANEGRTLAYHDSCHMLRELRIAKPPRTLLERSGARLAPLPRPDLCCGFGGTFSVRQLLVERVAAVHLDVSFDHFRPAREFVSGPRRSRLAS